MNSKKSKLLQGLPTNISEFTWIENCELNLKILEQLKVKKEGDAEMKELESNDK